MNVCFSANHITINIQAKIGSEGASEEKYKKEEYILNTK
jgi:hypothetical protein